MPEEQKKEEKFTQRKTKEELIRFYYVLASSEDYKRYVELSETLTKGKQIDEELEAIEKVLPELKKRQNE